MHDGVTGFRRLPGDRMREGRDADAIARFVAHPEAHGDDRASLVWARIDMSPGCIAGMERRLPRVKAVYGKFHVIQLANRALGAVRCLERQDGAEDLERARRLRLMDGDEPSPDQAVPAASLVRKRPRRQGRS